MTQARLVYLALVVTTALITGCATTTASPPPPPTYVEVVESWTYAHADELVRAWGAPTSTYPVSNGGHLLTYAYSNTDVYSTPVTVRRNQYSGDIKVHGRNVYSTNESCRVQFETDASGRIRRTSLTGSQGMIGPHHCKILLKGKPAWRG
jgi:hypothetical protein